MVQGVGLFLLTILSYFPVLFHIQEILFFSLLTIALLAGWIEGERPQFRTPIDRPLFLLVGWILLTIPFSLNPEYSFGEWRKLGAQCLVFYWAVYVIRKVSQGSFPEGVRRHSKNFGLLGGPLPHHYIFLGVIIGTLLLSALALGDFIGRGGGWQDRTIRAAAPSSDYNWLSTYLVISIPILFYVGVISISLWGKGISFVTLGLSFLAHAASYTRAGWLASAVQVILWGVVTRRRFLVVGIALGSILVAMGLLAVFQMGYQSDTVNSWTLETRFKVWKLGIDQILEHPILGIGYGNHIFQPVLADTPMGEAPMHLHNTLLMVGVGTGIPGLLFFVWVFIGLGRELFSKWRRTARTEEHLKLCIGIVLVGFLCRNLFDYMFAGSLAYLFWILMACGLESHRRITPELQERGAPGRIA